MRRILTTISANTLEALARRLNRSEISQEDIQLIAPEGKGYTALAWVNTYTGTLHAEYLDEDRDIVKDECTIEQFFQGPLTARSKSEAISHAIEEWGNAYQSGDGITKDTDLGWVEYDTDGAIIGRYWVEIDD